MTNLVGVIGCGYVGFSLVKVFSKNYNIIGYDISKERITELNKNYNESNIIFTNEESLLKKIPKKFLYYAHHWMILHGRYICQARKPNCKNCQIEKFCQFNKKIL